MALTKLQHQELGTALYRALRAGTTLDPLSDRYASIDIEDSYHISRAMLACRMTENHEIVVGKKIGVTSDVVQKMLGVFQPDFGFLTNTMAYASGADIPVAGNLIQPRAEGEIAFILSRIYAALTSPKMTYSAPPTTSPPALKWLTRASITGISRFKTRLPTTPAAVSMCWAMSASIPRG